MKRISNSTVIALAAASIVLALAMAGCNNTSSASSPNESSPQSTLASSSSDEAKTQSPQIERDESLSAVNDVMSTSWASVPATNTAFPDQFTKSLKSLAKNSGMDVYINVIDLKTGEKANVNGDKRIVSASMIKLAIAACLLEHADQGDLSLKDTYTLKETDIVGGTGSLGGRGAGTEVSYREMLDLMISESDNVATNIIIDTLGMDNVNKTAKKLGLKETELKRLMMDEEATAEGIENYTSANDVALLLELTYKGELVSAKASDILLEALRAQTDDRGILEGLPPEATFAHKTGTLGTVQHDGGIVETANKDGHDFVVVVLCGGQGFSQQGAFETMAKIGTAVYDAIENPQDASGANTDQ